jgi:predicted MFS family arabinose efflux permease
MASTFIALFLARLASGVVSGPVLPLMQSYAAPLGSDAHRGLRMGVVQGLGTTVLGGVLAPLMLVPIASRWGWRSAFLPVAALAIVSAVLLRRALPSTFAGRAESRGALERPRIAFVHVNVLLCSLIGAAMIGWLIVSLTFYPLYFVSVQRRSAAEMSALMSLMGASSVIAGFLVPYLSDRFGRRRIMIAFALLGVVGPLGLLLPDASLPVLAVSVFVGSLAGGTFPLFMAVIPSETVAARQLPIAIGWIQGIGEIAGGVVLPVAAGWAADQFGLEAPLLITLLGTLLAGLFALALRETGDRGSTHRK